MRIPLAVAAGGAIGASARYLAASVPLSLAGIYAGMRLLRLALS